jgi:hypothetical protein
MPTPYAFKTPQTLPPGSKPPSRKPWPALLMLCALSATGCATTSPPPPACACPALPQPPALTTPLPPQSYSLSAQELLQTWRSKLTATPVTPGR